MYAKVSKRAHGTRSKSRGFDCPYGRSSFKHIVRLTSADFHIIEVLLAISWRSAQHRLRDLICFRSFPSRECLCLIVLIFPSRECFTLISYQRTLPVVILVESWTVLAVFKPIGTKPLTLTFYFQLVDQYQPIALSGIHWWQSIKRSKGDQQYSRFSCISLRGMNGPRIYLFVGLSSHGG